MPKISDERLALVIHFPLDKIIQVCELAGARRAHNVGRKSSEADRERIRKAGIEYRAAKKRAAALLSEGEGKAG